MIDEKQNVTPVEEDEDFIELVDQSGRHLKFFHVGSTEYKSKWYAFFMPAEEIEGLGEDEVVIYEVVTEESGEEVLLPVDESSGILEAVYEKFCREMEEEADALEAEELEGECCCGHHHGEDHECCHGEGHHHGEDHECCHGEGRKKGECKKKNK